jgi:endonuclease III related protein
MKLLSLYDRMLAEYGPQGWWPADSPYEVMIGAILTQNTNWRNVERAIANLKAAGRLSPESMMKMKKAKLEALIRPSGFYRQKAERLKLASEKWMELQRRGAADPRNEWLSVKGIGKETADSILLYAFDLPFFVVDSYTRRFCAHHRLCEFDDYDDYKEYFESRLPRSVSLYKEYHALIVEWGKRNKRLGNRAR